MTRSAVLFCSSSLVGVVALLGCSSSEDGRTSVSSGLPGGATLAALDDADIGRLCDAISRSIASIPKGPACHVTAFEMAHPGMVLAGTDPPPAPTDASIRMACADAEAACMKSPLQNFEMPALCVASIDWKSSCSATVHELESCVADAIVRFENIRSARARPIPPCSSLTVPDLALNMSYPPSPPVPASCQVVEGDCALGLLGPD